MTPAWVTLIMTFIKVLKTLSPPRLQYSTNTSNDIMWTNNSAVITRYILFSNKWQQYHFGILRSAPYGITAHLLINYMHKNDQQDTGAVMRLTRNTPQLFRCWKLLHRRALMIFHHAFKFCHCPIIYSAYFTNIIKDFQIENYSW